MPSARCGTVLGLAKNGADRGTCSRRVGHRGRHGNHTCALCADEVTPPNAYCRVCSSQHSQQYRESEAAEHQQIQAIAGSFLVEETLNRILTAQSAA